MLGLLLYRVPIFEYLIRCLGDDIREYMRMSHNELFTDAVADIIDVKTSFFGRHLSMEHRLEDKITELLAHKHGVIVVDRFDNLVGFLNEVLADRHASAPCPTGNLLHRAVFSLFRQDRKTYSRPFCQAVL